MPWNNHPLANGYNYTQRLYILKSNVNEFAWQNVKNNLRGVRSRVNIPTRNISPFSRFPDNDMFYKFAEFTKSTTVFKHMTYFGRSIIPKTDNKIVVHNSISEVMVIHFCKLYWYGLDDMKYSIGLQRQHWSIRETTQCIQNALSHRDVLHIIMSWSVHMVPGYNRGYQCKGDEANGLNVIFPEV